MFRYRFLILSGGPDSAEKTDWTTKVAETLAKRMDCEVMESCTAKELEEAIGLADVVIIGNSNSLTNAALVSPNFRSKTIVTSPVRGTTYLESMRKLFKLGFGDVVLKTEDLSLLMEAVYDVLRSKWEREHSDKPCPDYYRLLISATRS